MACHIPAVRGMYGGHAKQGRIAIMLLYGGIGLLAAGLITYFFGDKIQKDATKAAQMKKQAPILMAVGVVFLVLRFMIAA